MVSHSHPGMVESPLCRHDPRTTDGKGVLQDRAHTEVRRSHPAREIFSSTIHNNTHVINRWRFFLSVAAEKAPTKTFSNSVISNSAREAFGTSHTKFGLAWPFQNTYGSRRLATHCRVRRCSSHAHRTGHDPAPPHSGGHEAIWRGPPKNETWTHKSTDTVNQLRVFQQRAKIPNEGIHP